MKKGWLLIGVWVLALPLMAGWREGSSEFEFFAGPHIGDTFTLEDAGHYTMEVKDSVLLGMRGSYFFSDNAALEMTLAGTRAETREGGDFDMYYYHGNILYQFGHAVFEPFVTLGIGVTTLRYPDSGIYSRHQTTDSNFSWNFGGGFKIYFNRNVALRTDVRSYWTNLNSWDDWNDDNRHDNQNQLTTTEISAGIVITF